MFVDYGNESDEMKTINNHNIESYNSLTGR